MSADNGKGSYRMAYFCMLVVGGFFFSFVEVLINLL